MPEIDMREDPWNYGIPVDQELVDRELYRLITIFAASRFLHGRRGDEEEGNVFGYSLRYFELPEVGRILVSVAAILRNDWDHRWQDIDERLKECAAVPEVGVLIADLRPPKKREILHVRESFNKILHAHTMNFERSQRTSLYSGYLHPKVHLYGQKNDKAWKAVIDIYRWADVVHKLAF